MTESLIDGMADGNQGVAVDFEITIAAFFATALLANPNVSPPLRIPTIATALLLLFITLIRRMAVMNEFSLTETILSKTTPSLVVLSTYSCLYFAIALGEYTAVLVPVSGLILSLTFIFIFCLFGVVVYEILFRDFFFVMAVFSFEAYRNSLYKSKYSEIVLDWVERLLEVSALDSKEFPPEADGIRFSKTGSENVDRQEEMAANIGVKLGVGLWIVLFVLIGTIFVGLMSSGGLAFGIFKFIIGVFSLLCINYLLVSMRFLYGRYGVMRFGELSSIKYTVYPSLVLYVLIALHLDYLNTIDLPTVHQLLSIF